MIPPQIKTIKKAAEITFKEKGSSFIASSFHASTREEIDDYLQKIKKRFHDASHHCYAYRLLNDQFKYSDDGEPSGTAGLRILNAIDHFELTNVLVIVTRYFGGVKLGVGPLGKAYYSSAEQCLFSSDIINMKTYRKAIITINFENLNNIYRLLADSGSKIQNTEHSENVKFDCLITPESIEDLKTKIIQFSRGEANIIITDDYYLI